MRCRLTGNWTNALKYEQMVLEILKKKEKKDEKAIEASEKKVKEYNTKMMMQMSMRSILGLCVCLAVISMFPGLYYVVLLSVVLLLSCCIRYMEKGVLVGNSWNEQQSSPNHGDEPQYDVEDQYGTFWDGIIIFRSV